jgi:signal recognition particle subunit SRP54
VVSLVEKAAQTIDVEKAQKIATKMKQGVFDLDDMAEQLTQMQKIGGMSGVLGMMPGVAKIKAQIADAHLDDKILKRQHAIITSMTPHERRNPKVLDARRKRRIAAGSGTKVEEVNRLVKMHRQMADMMKTLGRNKGMLNRLVGGGRGAAPSEAEMAAMQEELARLDPKALEQLAPDLKEALTQGAKAGLPKGLPGLGGAMSKLPGLGGGLPGLGGGLPKFPGLSGKKK